MDMRRKSFYFIAVIAAAVILFATTFTIFTCNTEKAEAGDSEVFYFNSVDMKIDVREDKTLAVTETLTAVWNEQKTSLIRDIQRVSKTTRVINGKKYEGQNYFAKISDISATLDSKPCASTIIGAFDELYLTDFFSIEMYDLNGAKLQPDRPYTFVLNYIYDMSDDKYKDFDDFTFDIFGYEMNPAENFHAEITFPESAKLDKSNVTAREGLILPWEPKTDIGESLEVDGNRVEVNAVRLAKGLTLQVILPDGFFNVAFTTIWYYWIFLLLAVISVILILVLTVKNLPVRPVKPVEFYPPEGLSVMEFSAIVHRGARTKDAAALILKWADAGLITISQDGPRDLWLVVNKDIDLDKAFKDKKYFDNESEKRYFKTLFTKRNGGVFSTLQFKKGNYSQKRDMYNSTKGLTSAAKTSSVLETKQKTRKLIPFMGLLPMALTVLYFAILRWDLIPLLFLIFMAAGTFAGTMGISEENTAPMLIIFIFPVAFFAMPFFAFVSIFALPLYDYAFMLVISPIIYAVCMFVLPFVIGRRKKDVNLVYGRILGFKDFLLKAELPRIQLLFDENPDYFSEILPWCMILGISDKVKKRFAALERVNMPRVIEDNISLIAISSCIGYCGSAGAPSSSGGGGGGGFGGSSGGGGGGGGSRSR